MFIIILENTINNVCSEQAVFLKKYKPSERGYISKSIKLSDMVLYNQPPLTAGGWLLLCENDLSQSIFSMLKRLPDFNVILFNVSTRNSLNDLVIRLTSVGIQANVIDNLKPEKERVVRYIMENCNSEEEVASYLYDRYSGYMPDIVTTVFYMRGFDVVTKANIRKYGVQRGKYAIFHLAEYLIGASTTINYKDAVRIVYDYQYNFAYLVKYLRGYVKQYIALFMDLESGDLSLKSLKSYKPPKVLADVHEYQLKKMIENYQRVPLLHLIWLDKMLSQINGTPYSSIKLISLLAINNSKSDQPDNHYR